VTQEGAPDTEIRSITVEQTATPAAKTESYEVRQLSAEEANQEAGDAAFQEGNFKAAVDDYRRSLEWNEKNAAVWNRLGLAYEKTNDLKNAFDAFEHAVRLDPNLLEAQDNLRRLQRTTSPD
jgi:Flp pilus assembly protein TadD